MWSDKGAKGEKKDGVDNFSAAADSDRVRMA